MSVFNKDHAFKIYFLMRKIRVAEEAIAEKYSENKMRCPTHLSIGQEAVPATLGAVIGNDDFAVSTHRGHAHYLGKGGSLSRMIAEIYGKETGCSKGRGGSMHLTDESVGFMGTTAIVGNSIPLGVGLALSIQLKKSKQISVVYLGDGAVEEGVFYEAVNFALVRQLPVLFVCENNLYSVYSPLSVRQPQGRKIFEMVRGMGLDSEFGDGNNAREMFDSMSAAVSRVRTGRPYLMELETYRWREHCGPNYDNHIGYRTEVEFQTWKKNDPIQRFQDEMLNSAMMTKEDFLKLDSLVDAEVKQAFQFAEQSPFPKNPFAPIFKERSL